MHFFKNLSFLALDGYTDLCTDLIEIFLTIHK